MASCLAELMTKIFADGADLESILSLSKNNLVAGFTTNPTLMRKAKVDNYEAFAKNLLQIVTDRPISFEVFADEFPAMEAQARVISNWSENVFVKVPVMNTKGEVAYDIIKNLSKEGVRLNVTAVFTLDQVRAIADALSPKVPSIVSVFAGRIADTGLDPEPIMREAKSLLESRPLAKLLWASPRELLNLFQADRCGTDIITMSPDQIKKLELVGKDLTDFSRETVEMFYRDALEAGYFIPVF